MERGVEARGGREYKEDSREQREQIRQARPDQTRLPD